MYPGTADAAIICSGEVAGDGRKVVAITPGFRGTGVGRHDINCSGLSLKVDRGGGHEEFDCRFYNSSCARNVQPFWDTEDYRDRQRDSIYGRIGSLDSSREIT